MASRPGDLSGERCSWQQSVSSSVVQTLAQPGINDGSKVSTIGQTTRVRSGQGAGGVSGQTDLEALHERSSVAHPEAEPPQGRAVPSVAPQQPLDPVTEQSAGGHQATTKLPKVEAAKNRISVGTTITDFKD